MWWLTLQLLCSITNVSEVVSGKHTPAQFLEVFMDVCQVHSLSLSLFFNNLPLMWEKDGTQSWRMNF